MPKSPWRQLVDDTILTGRAQEPIPDAVVILGFTIAAARQNDRTATANNLAGLVKLAEETAVGPYKARAVSAEQPNVQRLLTAVAAGKWRTVGNMSARWLRHVTTGGDLT